MTTTVQILYDYKTETPTPLYAAIRNEETEFLPLYMKGLNTKVYTVHENLRKIQRTIENSPVFINDAISIFRHINLDPSDKYEIYETNKLDENHNQVYDPQAAVNELNRLLESEFKKETWRLVKGNAAAIYSELEKRGIKYGPRIKHPMYDMKTYTGRSRTSGFNIQGADDNDPIKHVCRDYDHMVCCDWSAADMRMMGYLSGDKFIEEAFENGDPYQYMAGLISTSDLEITRSEIKKEILMGIYALDLSNPMFGLFPEFKEWSQDKINRQDFKTILGMQLEGRNERSSFNGMIQGSVAECIQSVLITLRSIQECILAETHDSLILSCSKSNVVNVVEIIKKVMTKPLAPFGIDIKFPVHIYIGKQWKQWNHYKTFRGE